MSITRKMMLALIIAALVVAVIIYARLTAELGRKEEEIARLRIDLSQCDTRLRDADAAIDRQNTAIEAVRVDTVVVERLVKEAEKKYAEVREIVVESIRKDSGCENKIDNIDFALRRFGAGMRPQDGNKD